jgi:hypothetical protein
MDLQTRKIAFVQQFLRFQSEEVISEFEKLLKKKISKISDEKDFLPMAIAEFNNAIDKSEDDFKNNRFKASSALLSKYSN